MSEPALEHGESAAPAETYQAFYGFAHGPFSLAPDARCFYRGATHGQALDALLGLIERRHGCAVVTAGNGTGKTTLARALVAALDRTVFAALILNPFLSSDELLREVLLAYGVVSGEDVHSGRAAAASHDDLAHTLGDFVHALASIGGHVVIVIDDAHNLPAESLDEVIRLSRSGQALASSVQVVLLGEGSLLAALGKSDEGLLGGSEPERLGIAALSRTELDAYVAYRLAEARSSTVVYVGPETVGELHRITGGVPRLVNLVCDRALVISARDRVHEVSVDAVRRAARALNLATPEAEIARPARGGARPWRWMASAVVGGGAAVLAAAFVTNIDLRLPPLPGVPHVAAAAPAEPFPVPVILDLSPLPELPPLALPAEPQFALPPPPEPQPESVPPPP